MNKRIQGFAILSIACLGFLGAAEPASETILPTAAYSLATLNIMETPIPPSLDMSFEVPAYTSEASYQGVRPSIPIVPAFRPAADYGKSLFDANLIAMVGLNVADYFSTRQALKYSGLQECNPLMKAFVKSPLAFAAVKFGTTALSYWGFKSLFKRNRTFAWVMTTATNCLLSCVVANNLQLARRAH